MLRYYLRLTLRKMENKDSVQHGQQVIVPVYSSYSYRLHVLYRNLPNTCIDVYNPEKTSDGLHLIAQPCSNVSTQRWSYDEYTSRIRNKNWEDACITEDIEGNLVKLETCRDVEEQQWSYDPVLKQVKVYKLHWSCISDLQYQK